LDLIGTTHSGAQDDFRKRLGAVKKELHKIEKKHSAALEMQDQKTVSEIATMLAGTVDSDQRMDTGHLRMAVKHVGMTDLENLMKTSDSVTQGYTSRKSSLSW